MSHQRYEVYLLGLSFLFYSSVSFSASPSHPSSMTATAMATGENINTEDNFPDPNFRNALVVFMKATEYRIFTAEQAAIQTGYLDCSNYNIKDLTGIQFFPRIIGLNCSDNKLTTLDLSKNTALTGLFCNSNQLKTLDVSKNTALTHLDCQMNQLSTLDVSENTALKSLSCGNNNLISLDVSKNTALIDLKCANPMVTIAAKIK